MRSCRALMVWLGTVRDGEARGERGAGGPSAGAARRQSKAADIDARSQNLIYSGGSGSPRWGGICMRAAASTPRGRRLES